MAITFSRRQWKGATASPSTATFGSTPIEGNLLVVFSWHREDHTEPTISGSGWTRHFLVEIGGTPRRYMACWSKVAGASEPSSITTDYGVVSTMIIQEFESGEAVTWTYEAHARGDGASVSSIATANTSSIAAGDNLELGFVALRTSFNNHITFSDFTSRAIGNLVTENVAVNSGRATAAGWAQTSDAGTRATTGNWSSAITTGASVFIVVFSAVGAASDTFDGAGASTLGALAGAGAGTHETPIFAGDAAAMLGAMLSQGTADQAFAFSGDAAAILPALAAAGTSTVAITFNGDGSATLGGLSAAGEATWTTVFNGDGEALLAGLLVSAAGTHAPPQFAGAGAVTLSPLAAEVAGSFAATFPADGAAVLAALAAAAAGSHAGPIFIGDATATLAALIAAAEASHTAPQFTASVETALAALQILAAGGHSILTFAAAGEATLGALTAAGSAAWSEFVPGAPGGRRGGLWPWGLRMGGG